MRSHQPCHLLEASAGIWGTPTSYADEAAAIADFQKQGITVLNTADVLAMMLGDMWMFPKIGVGPQNGWFIMENLY